MVYTLRGITAVLFISVSTVLWCTPLYLMGFVRFLLPAKQIRTSLGDLMDRIIDGWVFSNRAMVRYLHIATIKKPPLLSELERTDWNIVVCNHQSWTDILVLQNTFLGHIPPLKFFTKQELIYVPLVGVAMSLLGFPYVRRYSREQLEKDPSLREHDRNATLHACQGFLERPTSVLNFLEGTRYSEQKRVAQQSPYAHLLLPKQVASATCVKPLSNASTTLSTSPSCTQTNRLDSGNSSAAAARTSTFARDAIPHHLPIATTAETGRISSGGKKTTKYRARYR
ncbi:MAG: acetyltransferase [Pseudomonadales bacterium]|nr:acetyltransferase [Pseudomonadales bacterium]